MNKKKTHLLLFFTWDVSLEIWRNKGLLQRELSYYQNLTLKDVDITFITWGNEEDIKISKSYKNIQVIPLYTLIPWHTNKVVRAFISLLAPFKIKNIIKKSDVIKTNQMWGAWVAVISKIIYRKPLILRTGFELYKFSLHECHKKPRQVFLRILCHVCYFLADRIYVSTGEDNAFIQNTYSINTKKVCVRPNWIDTDRFKPLEIERKHKRILYVGRLSVQKNLFALIEALVGSDYTLDIVGDGELKNEIEDLALSLNVSVAFLGNRPNDELPVLYNSYPLVVLPSKFEGNPKTLLEAMSCGCAVLGTDVEGIRGLITHNKNGYLSLPNSEALKVAIEKLMKDEKCRLSLGSEARQTILAENNVQRLIAKELGDYKLLTERYNG